MRIRAVVVTLLLAASAWAQCPPQGMGLQIAGGRLGDHFALSLTGSPQAPGLLGLDLAGGPVFTPFGAFCLGFTPALQLQPFTLNASGSFVLTGTTPADPGFEGLTIFAQAAAADATQPGGIAKSNGATVSPHAPHLYLIEPVSFPSGPGSFYKQDVLTGVGGFTSLNAIVSGHVGVPELGWLILVMTDDTIVAFDGATGVNTLNLTLPAAVGAYGWANYYVTGSQPIVESNVLLTIDVGTTTAAGSLRAYSLPSGSLLWIAPVPPGTAGFVVPRGAGKAYAYGGATLLPVDLATGAASPAITLGPASSPISKTAVTNGIIHCVLGVSAASQSLTAYDTATQTALPAAVPVPGGIADILVGPGSAGASVFVVATGFATLSQRAPFTCTPTAPPITLPAGYQTMAPTAGGTEWLIVSSGGGGTLSTMNAATLGINPVASIPFPLQPLLGVVPSAIVRKAFLASSVANSSFVTINTDPTTPPSAPTPLTWTPLSLRMAID
jgi:hypothetical protein